jgi:hypothetical protein
MTKPNEHGNAPPMPSPIYRHASETQRSDNDAGGKLRQQYQRPSHADQSIPHQTQQRKN